MAYFNIESTAIPLDSSNIDTDQIIPKQFMSSTSRSGYGKNLFFNNRYIDGDYSKPNSNFILNSPFLKESQILLSRENFGCGSSREHAQWALRGFGIRAIIAVSFADIFYQNCIYNQILPISLNASDIDVLIQYYKSYCGNVFVSLQEQSVKLPVGNYVQFQISPEDKDILLNNLDSISITEKYQTDICRFEKLKPVG
ncbi:3-isopropylmalate dehydratase small subunit [Aliiglaciecola sp. LCG003]|uniref:3-isopropylmalate dehydratase small subunit n=1 Tax=Aliiglaciecola sp. LCG003 TaxID=3053655 RepID=UPI0025737050|nr:3-isopropylmalate dehydratase small subunit [Aliiglaciecola sp. LCG003]WJG08173.1 3-isopropylmalate dehydratase small subunit [Aliiglaciecola sp. LCG003]